MEPADDMSRYVQADDSNKSLRQSVEIHQPPDNEHFQRTSPNFDRFPIIVQSYSIFKEILCTATILL